MGLSVDTKASQRSLPLTISFVAASTADLIKAMNFSTAPGVSEDGLCCSQWWLGEGVNPGRTVPRACLPAQLLRVLTGVLSQAPHRPPHPKLCGKHQNNTRLSGWPLWLQDQHGWNGGAHPGGKPRRCCTLCGVG